MKINITPIAALIVALGCTTAWAQTAGMSGAAATDKPMTREQVKIDRNEFLQSHTTDGEGGWILKPGFQPPAGSELHSFTRTKVKMDRDEFLKSHTYDGEGGWMLKPGFEPPEGVTTKPLTRREVKMDTKEFVKTHEWVNGEGVWRLKAAYAAPAYTR